MYRHLAPVVAGLLWFTAAGAQETLSGRVVSVHDGDTLTLEAGDRRVRVRLWGIDAPELRQDDGAASHAALVRLCERRTATAEVLGRDRYGRVIARVSCEGVSANREQVRRGWAWVYDRYVSRDDPLHRIEERARAAAEGLWRNEAAVPPWEWRNAREVRTPPA